MTSLFKRLFVVVAAAAFLLSCTGLTKAATIDIHLKNNFFTPSDVSIVAGDTVQWIWDEGVHTTTSSDGLWDSGILSSGSTFTYTFNNPGDFAYTCTLHFNCCNMAGTVHVSQAPVAAQLVVSAPSGVTAGSPFDVTVTALDNNGNVAAGYTGTVTFSSSDPFPGVLPADYTFTSSDQGTHTFTGMSALFTAATQTLTAQDTAVSSITGSAAVAVVAAPASQLLITAPATAASGTPFDVTLTTLDPYGNVDMNYGGTVTWTSSDSDPGVVLPADHTFQSTDSGMVTFIGAVTLITTGGQMLTATDTASGITGTVAVTVQ
jgi:plastocyanin